MSEAKDYQFLRGRKLLKRFCRRNHQLIELPEITKVKAKDWQFSECAYYRPDHGIVICVERCQYPAGEAMSRNWSWPGATVDRTPYGVLAHELGHHADYAMSLELGLPAYKYSGEYSVLVKEESGEAALTSYAPNDAEWFAEMFRLFVTNPSLLRAVRPTTYDRLSQDWKRASREGWTQALGETVPDRIVTAQRNKFHK